MIYGMDRKPRDPDLIDALDAFKRVPLENNVWRVVPGGRDPFMGYPSRGRWDPGTFDVIYTSLEPDGAIAEIDYQLSSQPVRPTKIKFTLHEISVKVESTLRLANMDELSRLGVDVSHYSKFHDQNHRTQEIGDVAYFLDFNGMVMPGARWNCLNLVLFTDHLEEANLSIRSSSPVNFETWRAAVKRGSRGTS